MNNLGDVSLVIATYNEEESIQYVLDELESYNLGEIIIVDGGSTDKTEKIVKSNGLKFITQSRNGWGAAVKEGINNSNKDIVCYMDGDGSYNPNSLFEMRRYLNEYDVALGSRYKDGAKSPDDTVVRAIGNKIFTYLVVFLFGCKITDALFFYPMFRKNILEKIELESDDFTLCLEFPVLIHKNNFNYIELKSIERERYAGVTKVNAFFDGIKILYGMLKIKKDYEIASRLWERYLDGFTHIDITNFEHIDFKIPVNDLSIFEENSVELIYASHVIEYFDPFEVVNVLEEWKRVLIPGGTLRIAVPNFLSLITIYNQTGEIDKILGPLYGRWSTDEEQIYLSQNSL